MTREAREMKEITQETKEMTRDKGGDKDEAKTMTIRWRQRRTIGDDKGDKAKAKSNDGDNGETQEMKTTMEEGRIAPSMRDDEGREQTASIQDDEGREESHFNVYLYLVQDIYWKQSLAQPRESEKVKRS